MSMMNPRDTQLTTSNSTRSLLLCYFRSHPEIQLNDAAVMVLLALWPTPACNTPFKGT